jgi:3-methylfumaryl-CoA hydratase
LANSEPPASDYQYLAQWIGRTDLQSDIVTPRLVQAFVDTLGVLQSENRAPAGLHWCLAPLAVPMTAVGPDGHPSGGDFLPPVPLPRRMWAGGRLEFLKPLVLGETLERRSRIQNITFKNGRTGALCFVAVHHDWVGPRGLAITEAQDLVYRDFGTVAAAPVPEDIAAIPSFQREIDPSTVLLFRYSALTFNSHRIHYDRPYAHAVEGYPGLLVHGPLQATLLMDAACRMRPDTILKSFSFRSVAPLFDAAPFFTRGRILEGGAAELWVAGQDRNIHMRAEACWG